MTNWRFVRSWRWAGYLAFVVVFSLACVLLAQWQLARNTQAEVANTKVTENYDRAPADIETVLPALDSFSGSDEWRQVRLRGTYLSGEQLLVRTRALKGSPGFEVLVPIQLDNGNVFIVDRGWVPIGTEQDAPDFVPEPPAGPVTVIARLKPAEPNIPGRSAPDGQVATIELVAIKEVLDLPIYTGAYGLMVSEDPAPQERPQALPKPAIDVGPHLSYAFQWIVFGLLAFVALAWAVRQEYRTINADDPEERKRAKARDHRQRQRAPSDADIEDAIVDHIHAQPPQRSTLN